MHPESKSQITPENQKAVIDVINNQLYPEKQYPRTVFPEINSILIKHFNDIIKANNDYQKIYQNCTKKKIEELAIKILNFKNILNNFPRIVVLIYRQLIEKFIKYKHTSTEEKDDIIQEVITRLISDKIIKIQEKYDFNYKKIPSFTSYLMVTIRNIYIDILREGKKSMLRTETIQDLERIKVDKEHESILNHLFIEEELLKLQVIMKMYYKSRPKIEMCLKLKYRIPLNEEEVRNCFPECDERDITMLTKDFKFVKDKNVFKTIAPIFNKYESRECKSDTLRKWITVKIGEIIVHLNRTHDYDVYHTYNFCDLITLYYQKKNYL